MPTSELLLNDGWTFHFKRGNVWLPAKVPGCIHTDLHASGQISDPFFGTNEVDLQWIEREDWTYRCVFSLDAEIAELLDQEFVELVVVSTA